MANPEKREKSCGAVLYADTPGGRRYVLVQGPDGYWGFPKGHMEGDETETETARREVFEETGLKPDFLPGFRETDEYDLREKPGTRKRVVYFLADCGNAAPVPRPGEIRRILLLPAGEAAACFEHPGTRAVLAAACRFLSARPDGMPSAPGTDVPPPDA